MKAHDCHLPTPWFWRRVWTCRQQTPDGLVTAVAMSTKGRKR